MTKPRLLAAVTAAALLAGGTGTALAQTSGDVTVTVGPSSSAGMASGSSSGPPSARIRASGRGPASSLSSRPLRSSPPHAAS